MDATAARNVNELPAEEKRSLENLLGSSLEPDQHVLILTYSPGVLPEDSDRQAARERIAQTIAVNQRFAAEQGTAAAEVDSAISAAMDQVRRRT